MSATLLLFEMVQTKPNLAFSVQELLICCDRLGFR